MKAQDLVLRALQPHFCKMLKTRLPSDWKPRHIIEEIEEKAGFQPAKPPAEKLDISSIIAALKLDFEGEVAKRRQAARDTSKKKKSASDPFLQEDKTAPKSPSYFKVISCLTPVPVSLALAFLQLQRFTLPGFFEEFKTLFMPYICLFLALTSLVAQLYFVAHLLALEAYCIIVAFPETLAGAFDTVSRALVKILKMLISEPLEGTSLEHATDYIAFLLQKALSPALHQVADIMTIDPAYLPDVRWTRFFIWISLIVGVVCAQLVTAMMFLLSGDGFLLVMLTVGVEILFLLVALNGFRCVLVLVKVVGKIVNLVFRILMHKLIPEEDIREILETVNDPKQIVHCCDCFCVICRENLSELRVF